MASFSSDYRSKLTGTWGGRLLPTIYLGSKSSSRQDVLKRNGVNFVVRPANIDEQEVGNRRGDTRELVLQIAQTKAMIVTRELRYEGIEKGIVLAGDQVVLHEGQLLEKPTDAQAAREMLRRYGKSDSPCETIGSIILVDLESGIQVSGVDRSAVYLKPLTEDAIEGLIADGQVMNSSGALIIEHPLMAPNIERVVGSVDGVHGLSTDLLLDLMKRLRVQVDYFDCGYNCCGPMPTTAQACALGK